MEQADPADPKRKRVLDKIKEAKQNELMESIMPVLEYNKTPVEVKEHLDKFIIGQEQGKKTVATAIAFHYKRLATAMALELKNNGGNIQLALDNASSPKANILIIGPSGCGKTYTADIASGFVSVPFIKEDLTKFSETGYVGQDTSDIMIDLISSAGMNPYLAQMGIVYLDEADKIAGHATIGRDVSGKGVQNCILKMVEGVDNTLDLGMSRVKLSTKHVLFIASGAFDGLEPIVKRRLHRQKVETGRSWEEHILTQDLVEYGMERQLMGRFPVRVVYHPLSRDDLERIMRDTEKNPLQAYADDFRHWGIRLLFTESAVSEVAAFAEREGTGARGLTGILNKVLLEDMYALPGSYKGELKITKERVVEMLKAGHA